jgi:hypothetical protein
MFLTYGPLFLNNFHYCARAVLHLLHSAILSSFDLKLCHNQASDFSILRRSSIRNPPVPARVLSAITAFPKKYFVTRCTASLPASLSHAKRPKMLFHTTLLTSETVCTVVWTCSTCEYVKIVWMQPLAWNPQRSYSALPFAPCGSSIHVGMRESSGGQ